MGDQSIGHIDYSSWAPTAVIEGQIVRALVHDMPVSYSLWMGMFEAVDRLIVVPDNAYVSGVGQQTDDALFSLVKVLELVDKYVAELLPLLRCWIGSQIAVQKRDYFSNQHCGVKCKPGKKVFLESGVSRFHNITRIVMLQARLSRFVGFDALADLKNSTVAHRKVGF